jgi:short-subunit dehydrogenase
MATLITGASSGVGCELARLFARDGHELVLVARDRCALGRIGRALAHAHGINVHVIEQDLAQPDGARKVFEKVQRRSISVEVLVNSAGTGVFGPFAQTDAEKELAMLRLNVIALTELTKLFLPGMLTRGHGRILNLASTAAFQPGPLMAAYYASKAYVLSFSEAIANELAGSGVTVCTLCPGPTHTNFQRRAGMEHSRLFDRGVMDAGAVAAAGYRGLMGARTLVIPGIRNKLLAFAVRCAPRCLVPSIVRWMQEVRGKSRQQRERSPFSPGEKGRG